MTAREKDTPNTQETPQIENNPMVRTRLRTLLELAVTIGKREGLLGNNGELNVEGGSNVTDKGNIRDCKAAPAGEN
jgi:hypothetical protein